jgi:hypothetical protein
VTGIYRGKVSRQYPWTQFDGRWYPLEDQPYPVVSLADAGPDFDHTGMPVLVVANPDQGDHADLLAVFDQVVAELDARAIMPVTREQLTEMAAALRATLAQRDEARRLLAKIRLNLPLTAAESDRWRHARDNTAALVWVSAAPDPTENPDE